MHARIHVKRAIKLSAAGLSAFVPPRNLPQIVALMYHRVNGFRGNDMSVPPDAFRAQVRWLRDSGYENVNVKDLESGVPPSVRRGVIFTFDDGYEDNFLEAAPILKEYGYTAVFYIPVDFVGSQRMDTRDVLESNRLEHNRRMTWDQLQALLDQGMEIGSHTMSHPRLDTVEPEQARWEIADSKRELEGRLRAEIASFCYPGGCYDETHVALVREAGYRSATTASPGELESVFEIPRLAVQASDSLFVFKRKVTGQLRWFTWIR